MKVLQGKPLVSGKQIVRYPQAKRDEVIALFKAGYKIRKVAEISGVPKTTCYRWGKSEQKEATRQEDTS